MTSSNPRIWFSDVNVEKSPLVTRFTPSSLSALLHAVNAKSASTNTSTNALMKIVFLFIVFL